MPIDLTIPELTELHPKITVMGVGGAGCNAVNNMIRSELQGVDFIVANTDAQALAHSKADRRIQLGAKITQGLGAGSQPQVGMAAAQESLDEVMSYLEGSNMLFVTAGMGGGTGTGAAPIIAEAARQKGILTVGVVTKPFQFEGKRRMMAAEAGIKALQEVVDTLIIIPNQNLFRIATEKTTFQDAFAMADDVLHSGVRGITDLMVMEGLINLDFADVRTVMSEMGKAMMGTGEAEGESRAIEAAEAAISNPLLDEVSLKGAKGVIINITGGMDLTLFEVDQAANHIRSQVDSDANIIVGSAFNETLNGQMRVSVVATGIEAGEGERAPRPQEDDSAGSSVVHLSRHKTSSRSGATVAESEAEDVVAQRDEAAVVGEPVEDAGLIAQAMETAEQVADAAPGLIDEPLAEAPVTADDVTEEEEPALVLRTLAQMQEPEAAGTNPAPEPRMDEADVFTPREVRQPVKAPEERFGQPDPFAEAAFENGSEPSPRLEEDEAVAQPRGLSLFERLTGGRTAQHAPARAEATEDRKAPSFGRANAEDRPVPSRKAEDQLEIPAFLRRQAN